MHKFKIFQIIFLIIICFEFTDLNSVNAAKQVLSTGIVEERVKDLTTQIHWYKNLKEAEAVAKTQNKMIFWVQMLGDIDGGT